MRILNLFAGLGGNRTLWSRAHEVTAIEIDEIIAKIYRERFPHDVLWVTDVFDFLLKFDINLYDFIWASPPCQTHSQMQKFNKGKIPIPEMQEIYGLKVWLDWNFKGKYVIENVQPYYKTPINPTARIDRHCFWANFHIKSRRFREKRSGHGRLEYSHIMRDNKEKLITIAMLEDVKEHVLSLPERFHVQIIRNCVDPRIGKYILDQLTNIETLENYMSTN